MIGTYRTGDGEEQIVCVGPASGRTVLIVPPLFGELNRMRRFLLQTMEALGQQGIGSALPDLPGQNESTADPMRVTMESWRQALRDAATAVRGESDLITLALRGGTLFDDAVDSRCRLRFAPVRGERLIGVMLRATIFAQREVGHFVDAESLLNGDGGAPLVLAGHRMSPALARALQAAEPVEDASVRHVVTGALHPEVPGGGVLWLRAEPGDDPDLAARLAADIVEELDQCAVS